MSPTRFAYMPLTTYPEFPPEDSIGACVSLAAALGVELHATTFAVSIPRVSTPTGDLLINVPSMIRSAEEESQARCRHHHAFISKVANGQVKAHCVTQQSAPNAIGDVAAGQARYFDLALLPWSKDSSSIDDLAQTVVFGAGRPSILVPPVTISSPIKHIAVAWDASRVAARALADITPLLASDCEIAVLTVYNEKSLPGKGIAETLASSLEQRGFEAKAHNIALGRRNIAEALQETAVEMGSQMLAMGGFGHSRIRDFVLGGATKGTFADLRLPVLLSH